MPTSLAVLIISVRIYMYVYVCTYVCVCVSSVNRCPVKALRVCKEFLLSCSLSLSLSHVQNDRVLFHYNGHGVPKPTLNGEIWVFNKVSACGKGYQL